jgi:hypothetical protein
MPQQVEMDIIVMYQFLDVVIYEKSAAERLRGFIQAPAAFRNIYVVNLRRHGSSQTICAFVNLSVHDFPF